MAQMLDAIVALNIFYTGMIFKLTVQMRYSLMMCKSSYGIRQLFSADFTQQKTLA